jgi:hypothetical protein
MPAAKCYALDGGFKGLIRHERLLTQKVREAGRRAPEGHPLAKKVERQNAKTPRRQGRTAKEEEC